MVIVQAAGGLGNQMQQYAVYRKFLSAGADARLDLSWFSAENQENMRARRECELTLFKDLPIRAADPEEVRKLADGDSFVSRLLRKSGIVKSKQFTESRMYHEDLFSLRDAYVTGYFACNRYYEDIMPELRQLFAFPESADPENAERNRRTKEAIGGEAERGVLPVSVHIRRGDYLESGNAELFGGICTPAYYEGAVKLTAERYPGKQRHFYIFSDDPEYASSLHFGEEGEENTVLSFNTGRDSMLDMQLMSFCPVNICANSTFSFWGARLNAAEDAVRIRPLKQAHRFDYEPDVMHELWPGWELVDSEGRIR